jgi:hypothetical protein
MDQYHEMLQIYPTNKMTFEQKVNSIIRLVILISIICFLLSRSITYLVAGIVTIGAIMLLYYYQKNKEIKKAKEQGAVQGTSSNSVEGFEEINTQEELNKVLNSEYVPITKQNPLGNILLTDYTDNPQRKPAPPSFNSSVEEDVTTNIKKAVQSINPTLNNTSTQLFGGLHNKFELDQSNRAFYSTAITTIPNDQGSFASFLYGDMPSGKLDAEQRVKTNGRYNLY